MIVQQREDDTDRTPSVAIRADDSNWYVFRDDEIAEVITLPGGQVQVIDMTGERHDPIPGRIVSVTGTEFTVWINRGGEVTRYDEQDHVQQNPNGAVVYFRESGRSTTVGTEIRRAKRTELLGQ